MQFLTSDQAVTQFPHLISGVDTTNEWYRTELVFEPAIVSRQRRVGGGSPNGMSYAAFCRDLLDWLDGDAGRLLWVSHWEDGLPGYFELFEAARKGLGATTGLSGQPGLAFGPAPYHEFDVTVLLPEARTYLNTVCGLISLVYLGAWDGWLIAKTGNDRIEFWEGNVFFYSDQSARLEAGETLLRRFNCDKVI